MKRCTKCETEKPLDDFYASKSNLDGHHNTCKVCWRSKSQQRYQQNVVEINSVRSERRKTDPAYRAKLAEQNRRYWERNPGKLRERNIRVAYGITVEEYDRWMSDPCGICGDLSEHLDHDHETGIIRGPLCAPCNLTIGHAKENLERLEAAAVYLRNAKAQVRGVDS